MLDKVKAAVEEGGGEFTLHEEQVGSMHFYKTYRISGDITEDQIAGVSWAILMDFQSGWEDWQAANGEFFTAYAVEDLPSNALAFIASLRGTTPEALLDELEAYPTREKPPNPQMGGPQGGFMPMRLNVNTGRYEEVKWPWDLPMPINDPALWSPGVSNKDTVVWRGSDDFVLCRIAWAKEGAH